MDDSPEKCLIKAGGKNKGAGDGHRYFDRVNNRYLIFDDRVLPPDNYKVDINIFGQPVPKLPFMERENNKDLARRRPSNWMYKMERPATEDVG